MKRLKYYINRKKGILLRLFAVIILIIPPAFLRAGERDFNITVQNIVQTASNKLEFDVYILDIDPSQDFFYATSQLGFLLNSGIYAGGNITVTIDNRNPDFKPAFTAKPKVENKMDGYPDKTLIKLEGVNANIYGTGLIISKVYPGTLMTHFIITANIDFVINTTPDIIFTASTVPAPLYPTRVAAYINRVRSYLTVTPGVNALVYENPVLNPMNPPQPFEVTGSGSYCEGGEGLPVGLAGSEEGVKYTLFRNEIPQEPAIDGTGREISFGIQNAGEYTVTGMNKAGETAMKGSAIITESPLPQEPVISVDCTLGAGKAVVNITNPLSDVYEYRLDDGEFQRSPTFAGVANGNHTVTVRNSFGCTVTGDPFLVDCGCANPPVLILSSYSGTTCGTDVVTVNNNRFEGGATSVIITENGGGNVIPVSTGTSPFDFVYFPAESDIGRTVLITVTTNNPDGAPCEAASATYILKVSTIPSAPVPGTITHPSCSLPTGSVILNGLPSPGTWELTRSPDNVIITGSGTSTTIAGMNPGTYSFVVRNSEGCTSPSSVNVIISQPPEVPSAPVPGIITQPSCAVSTGSVVLNGLPPSGVWTVRGSPGAITKTGTGPFTTISDLVANTYTFAVTNSEGCTSLASVAVVIQPQPPIPTPPVPGAITAPTCTVPSGSVVLTGLPAVGGWTITRYPGTFITTGTGTSVTLTGIPSGTHNFTVTNSSGCTSGLSANVVIPAAPQVPSAPVPGAITHPTLTVPTGSVVISGLPSAGTWRLTRSPGNVVITGTGTTTTVSSLPPGTYTFTVTNSLGCISLPSSAVIINPQPKPPALVINNPPTICSTGTADLTLPEITAGSDPGLTFTYWYDDEATIPFATPDQAPEGTYYIKGTSTGGFFTIKPVIVLADEMPLADSGPDLTLGFVFETNLDALTPEYGNGIWTVLKGGGIVNDIYDPKSTVSELSMGQNILLWKVKNGVCPEAADSLIITVRDFMVPSLLTPNMDGKNDYFLIMGLETLGRAELVIFDRRGARVYHDSDYKNDWNGVDHKGNLLPEDTYFYILKSESGRNLNGFVVLRK